LKAVERTTASVALLGTYTTQMVIANSLPLQHNTASITIGLIPDDWRRRDGRTRTPRKSCLAISSYHSLEVRGPDHHDEATRRWCSNVSSPHQGHLSDSLSSRVAQDSSGSPITLNFPLMTWWARSPKPEQHSRLSMFPAHSTRSRLGTFATFLGGEVLLTTPSSVRFLRFSRRNWSFPV